MEMESPARLLDDRTQAPRRCRHALVRVTARSGSTKGRVAGWVWVGAHRDPRGWGA